jgi:hypothetical protein
MNNVNEITNQPKLVELGAIITNSYNLLNNSIDHYRNMNNEICGRPPEKKGSDDVKETEPNGLVNHLLYDANKLRELCDELVTQNRRLRTLVGEVADDEPRAGMTGRTSPI